MVHSLFPTPIESFHSYKHLLLYYHSSRSKVEPKSQDLTNYYNSYTSQTTYKTSLMISFHNHLCTLVSRSLNPNQKIYCEMLNEYELSSLFTDLLCCLSAIVIIAMLRCFSNLSKERVGQR
jgi:hypothetical protein